MAKKTSAKISFKALQQFIKDNQTWVIAGAALLIVLVVAMITRPNMFGLGEAGKAFAYPAGYDPTTEAYYACCWDGPDADNWPDWRARDCWKHNMRKCEAWGPGTEKEACEILCDRIGASNAEIENCEAAGTCQRRWNDRSNYRCHCYNETAPVVLARWDCNDLGGNKGWGYKLAHGTLGPNEFDGHASDSSGGYMKKGNTNCTDQYTCYLNANKERKYDDGLWCSKNQPDILCECYK